MQNCTGFVVIKTETDTTIRLRQCFFLSWSIVYLSLLGDRMIMLIFYHWWNLINQLLCAVSYSLEWIVDSWKCCITSCLVKGRHFCSLHLFKPSFSEWKSDIIGWCFWSGVELNVTADEETVVGQTEHWFCKGNLWNIILNKIHS